MDGTERPQSLSDSQLDRDIESAVGIEPSAEFLARVRTRIAAEPEPSAWRLGVVSAFRRTSVEAVAGVAIVGIVLALVVPQMLRPQPNGSDVVQSNQETGDAPPPVTAQVSPVVPRVSADVRRAPRREVVVESATEGLSSRGPRFEDLVLIAPGDQEAFDRLLAVVNDQSVELIAPVLESTRAGVDVMDAAVPAPLRTAEEGVNE
jgi:hypothetical protein